MKYSIIPQPTRFTVSSDKPVFKISSFMKLIGDENTLRARDELAFFLNDCLEITPIGGEQEIHFLITENELKKGSYSLKAQNNRIALEAGSPEGLFYAVQTLKQLLFQGKTELYAFEIYDEPMFESRGFLVDCGRYFFTKEEMYRYIDLMAIHKLNEFHWHLNDDQGFRCQFDCAPLLTEIGSYRSHTNFNTKEHSGYYTKQDIRDIVNYAHSKYIKVIPEIDTPGHTVSMISAYPELSCFNRELPVATHWGVKHDVLCVGKESTFEFMFRLFDELIEMFPDGVVHIGGDEVPTTRWQICPHCQKRMKAEGMKEESELHIYYLNRIARYLQEKGIEVRMWNDRQREKTVNFDICWQLWNDEMTEKEVMQETEKGRPFILSNISAYYLDLPYGQVSLKDTYNFRPVYYKLEDKYKDRIRGLEACLWGEFVPDIKTADYTSLPRLGAFSESAWTEESNKSYDRFCDKLDSYYSFLHAQGYTPASLKRANPKGIGKAASRLYWERRQLCWAGLSNAIDNFIVKQKYGKEKK